MQAGAAAQVYHEAQVAGLCGVHCLNTLLQGPYFTEIDLMSIAHEFDKKEKEVMAEAGTETKDFIKFVAEDSGNVADDGNYSIQVLSSALVVWNLTCIPLTNPEVKDVQVTPQKEDAFICNHSSHWLTLRKINGSWWNLNSLLKEPAWISDLYLGLFLETLRQDGYSIFVVRGEFPRVIPSSESGSGRWHRLFPGSSHARQQQTTEQDDIAAAIAMSLTESSTPAPALGRSTAEDEEAALQEAIALSAQLATAAAQQSLPPTKLPTVPAEPLADTKDSIKILFRTAEKRLERRFLPTNTLDDLYAYLTAQLGSTFVPDQYRLVATHPHKSYERGPSTLQSAGILNNSCLIVEKK